MRPNPCQRLDHGLLTLFSRLAPCCTGWIPAPAYNFYELHGNWMGCTEPRAANYNSIAVIDDQSCQESDTCVSRQPDGSCSTCIGRHGCSAGNIGYRHPAHDTVYAQYLGPHVSRGATVDILSVKSRGTR